MADQPSNTPPTPAQDATPPAARPISITVTIDHPDLAGTPRYANPADLRVRPTPAPRPGRRPSGIPGIGAVVVIALLAYALGPAAWQRLRPHLPWLADGDSRGTGKPIFDFPHTRLPRPDFNINPSTNPFITSGSAADALIHATSRPLILKPKPDGMLFSDAFHRRYGLAATTRRSDAFSDEFLAALLSRPSTGPTRTPALDYSTWRTRDVTRDIAQLSGLSEENAAIVIAMGEAARQTREQIDRAATLGLSINATAGALAADRLRLARYQVGTVFHSQTPALRTSIASREQRLATDAADYTAQIRALAQRPESAFANAMTDARNATTAPTTPPAADAHLRAELLSKMIPAHVAQSRQPAPGVNPNDLPARWRQDLENLTVEK